MEERTVKLLLLGIFFYFLPLSFVGWGEDLHSLFLGFPHQNCDIPQRDFINSKVKSHPEAGFMVGIYKLCF